MSQLATGKDWHDEDWALRTANLNKVERMRRITAVNILMDSPYYISDGLYSELVVLLEALEADDLKHSDAG